MSFGQFAREHIVRAAVRADDFAALRDVTWLNDVVFAVSVAVAALGGLLIEVWVVLRAKGTYVDPD